MKLGHTYFIKEINNPTSKIQEVTCTHISQFTYKLINSDNEIMIIEKSEISDDQTGIKGYRIIEDLGIVPNLEEE